MQATCGPRAIAANSADPDETLHHAASHLGLHALNSADPDETLHHAVSHLGLHALNSADPDETLHHAASHLDDPITGNVMNISAVTEPRKEYTDYRVGDVVKARCGSFGVVPAIIGKIGDKAEKKDLEKLLSMPQMFSTLIDSFIPEILVMKITAFLEKTRGIVKASSLSNVRIEGNGLPKMSSEETASSSDNLEETVSKAADANNQKQTGNGSKEVKNPTVVKPKAVRRKLSIVPYEVRNPKVLQSDAEDRALASFHVQMEIEQTEIDQSE
ncbi:hypothetical protein DPMN_131236, partial [Dreissena polymorpha]